MAVGKSRILSRFGSRSAERLRENAGAADIHLQPQEVAEIDEALEQMRLLVFDGSVLPDESKQEAYRK